MLGQDLGTSADFALTRSFLTLLTVEALGRPVGSHFAPLDEGEVREVFHVATTLAGSKGVLALAPGLPIDGLFPERLQQQIGAFGRSALEQPEREGPQNENVLAAADTARCHGAQGLVDLLVHVQVEQCGVERLALAGVSRDREGRSQLKLLSFGGFRTSSVYDGDVVCNLNSLIYLCFQRAFKQSCKA